MFIWIHMYAYINIYTYTYLYIYVYIYTHTYICEYIYIYKTTTRRSGQVHRTGVAKISDTLSSYLEGNRRSVYTEQDGGMGWLRLVGSLKL